MSSSNGFNICPRCGNSNALNAKFCSRCGGQLKVPEEPIVCHKCRTHNSPMANFCRNCGATLKVGSEVKLCPRCGNEVSGDISVCNCGYMFGSYQQTMPTANAVDVSVLREEQAHEVSQPQEQPKPEKIKKEKKKKEKVEKVYSKKGGRGWAIVGILLVLLFAYYIVAPFHLYNGDDEVVLTLRPEFLVNLDNGFVFIDGEDGSQMYGFNYIYSAAMQIKVTLENGGDIGTLLSRWGVVDTMLLALVVIFALTALIHLIVCIIRSFTAKRSKKMNWYFLILAILSTLDVGLILLFKLVAMPEGFLQTVANWFALPEGISLGYAIWAIPLYFWFFFFYSLCAKAKQLKEHA